MNGAALAGPGRWTASVPEPMPINFTRVPGMRRVHFTVAGAFTLHDILGALESVLEIPEFGPGYQVPLARAVKAATGLPTIAVGLITDFDQAEMIVGTGDADLIALARAMLYDPRWPWHAAAHLGATVKAPKQYLRSQPRQFPKLLDG